jgi:S-adenosylmethionine-diacylglycerol 3-amino-3-carboxypropyl transferase
MDFYKSLNYTLGNEDWHVEEQALRVKAGDRVVCVTASGDRPLHLLMTDCAEVISVDMNQAQTALLDLKLAAISQLDFHKYLAFLGCDACTGTNRLQIFKEIKKHLSPQANHFWEKNQRKIAKGIIYQGKVERLTYFAAKILNLIRPTKIKTLLAFTDLDAQRDYVKTHWDTPAWRKMFQVLLDPRLSKLFSNDPGLNAYVDDYRLPGNYIYGRMLSYLDNQLANKSALLQLLLTGKVVPEAYFPYLTFEGYSKIRRDMRRLTVKSANIIEYLGQHKPSSFDCFSMSDIASYMPQTIFEKLLASIYNAAKPNARFCLREFISVRAIPNYFTSTFERDLQLEKKLENEESNFVYRFIVGQVQK